MSEVPDLRQAGTRVEELLGQLRAEGNGSGADLAEEIVRTLLALYGAGLERVLDVAEATGGDKVIEALGADPLVGSILVLHGVHPTPVADRIQTAIDNAAPQLGGKTVEVVGFDDEGVLLLRAEGCGCPSTTAAVQNAVEAALVDVAPEVVRVSFATAAAVPDTPVAVSIGRPPPRRVTLSVAPSGD